MTDSVDNPMPDAQDRADAEAEQWLQEQPECYKCSRPMQESYLCCGCGESVGCFSCMYLGDDGNWYCEYCIPQEPDNG